MPVVAGVLAVWWLGAVGIGGDCDPARRLREADAAFAASRARDGDKSGNALIAFDLALGRVGACAEHPRRDAEVLERLIAFLAKEPRSGVTFMVKMDDQGRAKAVRAMLGPDDRKRLAIAANAYMVEIQQRYAPPPPPAAKRPLRETTQDKSARRYLEECFRATPGGHGDAPCEQSLECLVREGRAGRTSPSSARACSVASDVARPGDFNDLGARAGAVMGGAMYRNHPVASRPYVAPYVESGPSTSAPNRPSSPPPSTSSPGFDQSRANRELNAYKNCLNSSRLGSCSK